MNLCDIKQRLRVSGSHSVRNISTAVNVYIFQKLTEQYIGPILPEVTIESRSITLKSFELHRRSGNMQSHSLLHSFHNLLFEVSNYYLFV